MMLRSITATATAVVLSGAAVSTGSAMQDTGAALGRIALAGATGVSVADGPAHAAVVQAPPGTAMLAIAAGALTETSPGHAVITGAGEDAGLAVTYDGLDDITSEAMLERGEPVGHVLTADHQVTVHALLDGQPLDTASLLRAALNGIGTSDGGWTKPVDGAVVTQAFGCTSYAMEPTDHSCPSGHIHTGIDLAAPLGTPVVAALDGIVHVAVSPTGFGLHVILDCGDGLTTLYGHLASVAVHDGDEVTAGDVIGAVGSTGNSTGPHLHFEVRRDGIPEDPSLDVALP